MRQPGRKQDKLDDPEGRRAAERLKRMIADLPPIHPERDLQSEEDE